MSSRNSTVEPLDVTGVLRNSTSIAAKPSPVERVATPGSTTNSASSSRPQSLTGRDMSGVFPSTTSGHHRHNRFSVSFPIVPSNSTSPVRSARSPVREAPSVVPESLALLTGPTDGNFLTAIATQERRVLELKEELSKAEANLVKLKRQWAQHEAQKKNEDAKSTTKLLPLKVNLPTPETQEEDSDGSNAWMQQEMERRKSLMSSSRSTNRTVFSGSRQTRTLSLLSTANGLPSKPSSKQQSSTRPMPPPRKDSLKGASGPNEEATDSQSRRAQLARAQTVPDMSVDSTETITPEPRTADGHADRDTVLKTGKKVATDLRDGLWTFWEDLRQVTVGDEVTKIEPPARRRGSSQNMRTATKKGSKGSLQGSTADPLTTNPAPADPKWWPGRFKSTPTAAITPPSQPMVAEDATENSFFAEFESPMVHQRTPVNKTKLSTPAKMLARSTYHGTPGGSSDLEAWDNWDETSPVGSRASSAVSESTTHPSTVSNAASPRTSSEGTKSAERGPRHRHTASESSSGKKDPIPWPALSNLGTKTLRRTASHLMAEWDKSLTPTSSNDEQIHGDYLGLGAEAAASAVPTERRRD